MCLHPRLLPLILDQGSLPGNRVQGIRFKGLEGGILGFLMFIHKYGWGQVCHVKRSLPISSNTF